MKTVAFKLVFRSWWRNKTFSVISIVSLAIGIACTNLLAVFVIYEYNLEKDNPARNRIYFMDQDSPMKSGERISFVTGDVPVQLKAKYPEIEDFLQISGTFINHVVVDSIKQAPLQLITTNPSFLHFFPYKTLYGSLEEVLNHPDQIALTEEYALKYFGKKNPVNKTITIVQDNNNSQTYRIGAILKSREQSYLTFDAIVANNNIGGGITLLMTRKPIDTKKFSEQLKKDNIPLFVEGGNYYFTSLPDHYFSKREYNIEITSQIKRGQSVLLYVSIVSAILIFLIACFNYINLNFSRLLQQVRMIHTQKLMGATSGEISKQIFIDTFMTVFVAFLLSLLIIHDLIPLFNQVVSGSLKSSFFFDKQVLPVIVLFILFLSIIPAFYMSRKISGLTTSDYRQFFTGNKKKKIVAFLSITQFAISITLIISTLTVNSQLRFIQNRGECYQNLIEVGNFNGDCNIASFVDEIKKRPEIEAVSASPISLLWYGIAPITIRHDDGSESLYTQSQYFGGIDYLSTMKIGIIKGLPPEEAVERYGKVLYLTRKYAKLLIPDGENPVGQLFSRYETSFKNDTIGINIIPRIIAGITEDIYSNSLSEEVNPAVFYIDKESDKTVNFAEIRLGKDKAKALLAVREVWNKVNPDKYFSYLDTYGDFMKRNKKFVGLSHLLIMYSLISIFLTCFGLFGMALYATEQRTKEIGIRKVNGASTLGIMLLLNKQFIGWIGIAFVIAIPIAWLFLNRWLEQFPYHTDMSVFHFLLGGITVLFITLLTVSWHTYKAASGNPVNVLRSE